jgi:hypothetical protein
MAATITFATIFECSGKVVGFLFKDAFSDALANMSVRQSNHPSILWGRWFINLPHTTIIPHFETFKYGGSVLLAKWVNGATPSNGESREKDVLHRCEATGDEKRQKSL